MTKIFSVVVLVAMFAITLLADTSTNGIPADTLINLKMGISRKKLESLLGGTGKYQFSAEISSNHYSCVSFAFEKPYLYYYFMFKDGELFKIVSPPPFDKIAVPYDGAVREVRTPVDPVKRINAVFAVVGLTGKELVNDIAIKTGSPAGVSEIIPAFIITGPLLIPRMLTEIPSLRKAYKQNEEIAKRFNPDKLQTGMSEQHVKALFGDSKIVVTNGAFTILIFGETPTSKVKQEDRASWVAVVVENGKVTRIYCNDFFEKTWLEPKK